MQAAGGKLLLDRDGPIGRLTINQPGRRNAVSLAMWQALPELLVALAADDAVRVLVVRGAGGRAFSAGNDISEFGEHRATKEGVSAYNAATRRAYAALADLPKPVIAAIEGYCIGGGLEVALLCDIQIAADNARFAVTPVRLGLGYKYEDVALLVRSVGARYAKEILFTGRQFSADEALRMGLVNHVVPAKELDAFVDETARTIAQNAPLSLKAAKLIIAEAAKGPGQADLALCERLVDACHASADYQEGQRAFAEKREPRFTGR